MHKYDIGLVTCREVPELYDDDIMLKEALVQAGASVLPVVWDDNNVCWQDFRILVLRSVWDYHLRTRDFIRWVSTMQSQGLPLANPASVVLRNAHKSYLKDMEHRGMSMVPSRFCQGTVLREIDIAFTEFSCDTLVIKPLIGASAYRVLRINRDDKSSLCAAAAEYCDDEYILQPYLAEIEADGEQSFVFFDRRFSHAVFKRPCDGEIRVQDDYGGTFTYCQPKPGAIAWATEALSFCPGDLLFGRVDAVFVNGQPRLMEIELIDAILYLHDNTARSAFVAAIFARIGRALPVFKRKPLSQSS